MTRINKFLLRQRLGINAFYVVYIKFTQPNMNKRVSRSHFGKIVRIAGKVLGDMLVNNKQVLLPYGLGMMSLVKFKTDTPRIDFKATRETGEIIYYQNRHTQGYAARIKWSKSLKTLRLHPFAKMYRFKTRKPSYNKSGTEDTASYKLSQKLKNDPLFINEIMNDKRR